MTGLSAVFTNSQSVGTDSRQTRPQRYFGWKTEGPIAGVTFNSFSGDVGHYLISDRPLTEDEWIEQRTKVIEAKVTPALSQESDADKPSNPNGLEEHDA